MLAMDLERDVDALLTCSQSKRGDPMWKRKGGSAIYGARSKLSIEFSHNRVDLSAPSLTLLDSAEV